MLVVHTFRRSLRHRFQWRRATLRMRSDVGTPPLICSLCPASHTSQVKLPVQDAQVVSSWADDINAAAKAAAYRPLSLYVVLNPFGGAKRAQEIWAAQVLPIFRLAGTALCSCLWVTNPCSAMPWCTGCCLVLADAGMVPCCHR